MSAVVLRFSSRISYALSLSNFALNKMGDAESLEALLPHFLVLYVL